jgi:hypothetical protein
LYCQLELSASQVEIRTPRLPLLPLTLCGLAWISTLTGQTEDYGVYVNPWDRMTEVLNTDTVWNSLDLSNNTLYLCTHTDGRTLDNAVLLTCTILNHSRCQSTHNSYSLALVRGSDKRDLYERHLRRTVYEPLGAKTTFTHKSGRVVDVDPFHCYDGAGFCEAAGAPNNISKYNQPFTITSSGDNSDVNAIVPHQKTREFVNGVAERMPTKEDKNWSREHLGVMGPVLTGSQMDRILFCALHLCMCPVNSLLKAVLRLHMDKGTMQLQVDHWTQCNMVPVNFYLDKNKLPACGLKGNAMKTLLSMSEKFIHCDNPKHKFLDEQLCDAIRFLVSELHKLVTVILETDFAVFTKAVDGFHLRSLQYVRLVVTIFGPRAYTPTLFRIVHWLPVAFELCIKRGFTFERTSNSVIESQHRTQESLHKFNASGLPHAVTAQLLHCTLHSTRHLSASLH